jgi:nitroreductase
MFDESPADAWQLRFGQAAPKLPDLGKFLNHRSVRKYKADPIDEDTLKGLIAAAQSAATSSNLQLWSVVSVMDPSTREELATMCENYRHVKDCAVFLAFLADHYRLRKAASEVGEQAEGLGHTEFYTMAVVDAALAAERMVCAAESLGIGICYIGALRNDPEGVKRILDLPTGTFGLFGLCLGWPEEPLTAEIKPRLPQESIWFREKYDPEVGVGDYDQRMHAFYESQKMKGKVNWSMRSGRRVDLHHMTGRETQLDFLKAQGFLEK